MPNWITNEVTFTHANPHKLEEMANIFRNEAPFNHLIPQPDWPNVPAEEDIRDYDGKIIAKKGELPEKEVIKFDKGLDHESWNWPSSGRQDDRWYRWRTQNWGCKWDIHDVEVDYQQAGNLVHLTFNTPWGPPEGIYIKLREMGYEFLMWDWEDECEGISHDLSTSLEVAA
tara:strand:- start:8305 stop:8817 length:513 start_codon:yes stop_codon:yes gene_type:complete